jgi:hypothetical protein
VFFDDSFYKGLLEPLFAKETRTTTSSYDETLQKALSGQAYYLTPKQAEVLVQNLETFKIYLVFENDYNQWGVKDLEKLLKLTAQQTKTALDNLLKINFIKFKNKKYQRAMQERIIEWPNMRYLKPDIKRKYYKNLELLKKTGKRKYTRYGTIRADEVAFSNYLPLFRNAINACQAYIVKDKTKYSGIFYVEGTVTKLFDF